MATSRIPVMVEKKEKEVVAAEFMTGAEKLRSLNLVNLSDEDLASRYDKVEVASYLVKGLILTEAKRRFNNNNIKFGKWIKDNGLDYDTQQTRSVYMSIANFFGTTRDINGISLSVAMEISREINAPVAETAYEYAHGRSLSVAAIRRFIAKEKEYLGIIDETPLKVIKREEARKAKQPDTIEGEYRQGTLENIATQQEVAPITQNISFNDNSNISSVNVGNVKTETVHKNESTNQVTVAPEKTKLGSIMPLDIIKMAQECKEPVIVDEDDETEYEPPEYHKFKKLTKEEKLAQVKTLLDIISLGNMEAFDLAQEVAAYYQKARYPTRAR